MARSSGALATAVTVVAGSLMVWHGLRMWWEPAAWIVVGVALVVSQMNFTRGER